MQEIVMWGNLFPSCCIFLHMGQWGEGRIMCVGNPFPSLAQQVQVSLSPSQSCSRAGAAASMLLCCCLAQSGSRVPRLYHCHWVQWGFPGCASAGEPCVAPLSYHWSPEVNVFSVLISKGVNPPPDFLIFTDFSPNRDYVPSLLYNLFSFSVVPIHRFKYLQMETAFG